MRTPTIAVLVALSMMTVGLAPSAIAGHGDCESADNVEVCDADDDPAPEHVTATVEEEGVASLHVEYKDYVPPWGGRERTLTIDAEASDSEAHVFTNCKRLHFEEKPCGSAWTTAEASSDDTPESTQAQAYALCEEPAQSFENPECFIVVLEAFASYGSTAADASLVCGSSFFPSEPCPNLISGQVGVSSDEGDQTLFIDATPGEQSLTVCLEGDFADPGCASPT